jgi:ATP-binding cassette, subfamily C (CFTR/MRP), member 4
MSAEEKQKSLKNPNDPNNLKVKLEEMKKPIITGLNLDLKSGDFLTVVG